MTLTTNAIKKKQQHRTINLETNKIQHLLCSWSSFFFFFLSYLNNSY